MESFVIGGQIKGFMSNFAAGMAHRTILVSFVILTYC